MHRSCIHKVAKRAIIKAKILIFVYKHLKDAPKSLRFQGMEGSSSVSYYCSECGYGSGWQIRHRIL